MVCEAWTNSSNPGQILRIAFAASEVENPDRTDITTAMAKNIPETMMLNGQEISFSSLETGGGVSSPKPGAGMNLKH